MDLDLAIVQVGKDMGIDQLWIKSDFFSMTKTEDETSLVVESKYVQQGWKANTGWKALKVEGVLDFALVGILKKILGPLAEAGISVFALSTYNTDYVLVKDADFEMAKTELKSYFEVKD